MTAGAMASARRMVVVFIAMEQTVTNVSLRGAEGPAGGSANINMLIDQESMHDGDPPTNLGLTCRYRRTQEREPTPQTLATNTRAA